MQRLRRGLAQYVMRIAILVAAGSLLLVPVRCDASPDPHSIFIDPMVSSDGAAQQHDHGSSHAESHQSHAEAPTDTGLPSADPVAEILYVLAMSPTFAGDSDTESASSSDDGSETTTDLKSMNGSGGMFDTVFSVSLRSSAQEQRVVVNRVLTALPGVDLLTGRQISPTTPPPR